VLNHLSGKPNLYYSSFVVTLVPLTPYLYIRTFFVVIQGLKPKYFHTFW